MASLCGKVNVKPVIPSAARLYWDFFFRLAVGSHVPFIEGPQRRPPIKKKGYVED